MSRTHPGSVLPGTPTTLRYPEPMPHPDPEPRCKTGKHGVSFDIELPTGYQKK